MKLLLNGVKMEKPMLESWEFSYCILLYHRPLFYYWICIHIKDWPSITIWTLFRTTVIFNKVVLYDIANTLLLPSLGSVRCLDAIKSLPISHILYFVFYPCTVFISSVLMAAHKSRNIVSMTLRANCTSIHILQHAGQQVIGHYRALNWIMTSKGVWKLSTYH